MKRKECRYYFSYRKLLSLILIILIGVSGNDILAGSLDGYIFDTIYLPPHADSLSIDIIDVTRKDVHPKLDFALARVAAEARLSVKDALALAQIQSLKIADSRVQVQIITHAQGSKNAVEAVIDHGGEMTSIGYNDTLIQGWLPVSELETVAACEDIYLIRKPSEAIPFGGNSETEALDDINAIAWHAEGIKGAGVKIGIIDKGFKGYSTLLGTDLPAHVTVKNFVDGEDDSLVDGTHEHGTACAEVIYDIAPEASFYLAKISSDSDLEEAVNWLKDIQEADIISTSLGWYNETPGDGTGKFADLAEKVRNAGILWVTAAGNDRESHWGGPFYDPEGDNIHNFNGGQFINYFGPGDGSAYPIPAGYLLKVLVRWDDWTNVTEDYDLYVLRWNGASWETIAESTYIQNGQPGQTPTEAAVGVTIGDNTAYGFAIVRYSSSRNVNFEVFAPKFPRLDEIVHARSLANLADVPDIVTVAALDVTPPCPQEPYSSEGPTNGPAGTATGGFVKPDISGFANITCECYKDGFPGTSAATPHVAGAAALVLSAYPDYTPDLLQSFLEGNAIDMGISGMDTQFGYGRLFLDEPPVNEMTWNPAGLDGKYINDLAIDPDSSDTVFAAIKEGHLAITTDYGVSWDYLADSYVDQAAVAVDPQNTSTIFSGDGFKYQRDVYIYKSTNGGQNWTGTPLFHLYETVLVGVTDIWINPNDSNTVLVTVKGGTDFIGLHGGGVYRSTDGGETWHRVYSSVQIINATTLASNPQNPQILYFGTSADGFVYQSIDGGNSWALFSPSGTWVNSVRDIEVDLNSGVYVATNEGLRKKDGTVWTSIIGLPTDNVTALSIDRSTSPGIIYAGTSGDGVYFSRDGGSTWTELNEGLGNLFITKLSISEGHPKILYAGTDYGGVWSRIIKEANDNDLTVDFGTSYGIWVRYDDGTWEQLHGMSPEIMVVGDIDCNERDDLIVDFGATNGIWVRYDDGTWEQLHGMSPEIMIVGDIDGNGCDGLIVDFGTAYGIWVRYDDGSWEQLHGLSPEIIVVGDIDCNERDDLIVDFRATNGIWVRYDDGTWEQLHGMSPEIMIVGDIDGNGCDGLIVDFGTAYGIWVRYDDGSWEQLHGLSPEIIVVGDIDCNERDDLIVDFGATNGIWVRYDDGTWEQLHGMSPEIMIVADIDGNGCDDLIVDFGTAYGIWVRYDDGSWEQLHGLPCEDIIAGDIDGN